MKAQQIDDIKYVRASGLQGLTQMVKIELRAGYQPYGPVVVEEKFCGYIQTMVKYAEETPK